MRPAAQVAHVRRIVDESIDHERRQRADRHVDIEIPAPAPRVGDIAADGRTHDRRDHHADSPHRHRHRLLARRKGLHQDGLRQRHHRGAGRPLHQAEEHDLVERLRDAAQRRRHHEHRDRGDEVALAPEALGDPSGHRDHDAGGDQVARDDPRDLIDAGGEAALHMRQRDVDDRAVEDLEHGAEHHRERDDPFARRGKLVDLVRSLGNRFRCNSHRGNPRLRYKAQGADAKDSIPAIWSPVDDAPRGSCFIVARKCHPDASNEGNSGAQAAGSVLRFCFPASFRRVAIQSEMLLDATDPGSSLRCSCRNPKRLSSRFRIVFH